MPRRATRGFPTAEPQSTRGEEHGPGDRPTAQSSLHRQQSDPVQAAQGAHAIMLPRAQPRVRAQDVRTSQRLQVAQQVHSHCGRVRHQRLVQLYIATASPGPINHVSQAHCVATRKQVARSFFRFDLS